MKNSLELLRAKTSDAVGFWTGYDLLTLANGRRFSVILADPPWNYRDSANAGKRGAKHKYATMTLYDIASLPISAITAPDCLLAMWWVPPMPEEALTVMRAWGFRLVNFKGFTWRKLTTKGNEHFGMGSLTRGNSEDCLFAVRGRASKLRIDAGVRQHMSELKGEHSEKPAESRRRLVRLCGDVPRIELFATKRVAGWESFGLGVK